ncbi:hypothetical protein GE061_000414 [Apolygus lucorum]|uniref:Gustatory receptor n=1 Tax=Apolygus lucorum TaxID=248454 RepID=A0A8S9Y6Z2_APOLU|nr:hypothetical protein GE061_000414 [Apolygus lucorum]
MKDYTDRVQELLELQPKVENGAIEAEWNKIKDCVVTAAKDILGERSPNQRNEWFDDECARATTSKNKAYQRMIQGRRTRGIQREYEDRRRHEKKIHRRKKRELDKKEIDELQEDYQSNRFMILVRHLNHALDSLLRKMDSSERSNTKELIKNYNDLYEVAKLFNDAYSLQNLVILTHHLFVGTFALYYFFEAVLHLYPADVSYKKYYLSSLSALFYFVMIILKFTLCQTTKSKAEDFKLSLYDRISSDPDASLPLSAIPPIYKEIKFSAFNVVDLDYQALNSIVMTIVTYQVILLQFTTVSSHVEVDKGSNTTKIPPLEYYG